MRSTGDGTAGRPAVRIAPRAAHRPAPRHAGRDRVRRTAAAARRATAGVRADRLPRSDGLRGRRHHLPPAGLLGAHRPRGAERAARVRLRAASGSTASATSSSSRSSSGSWTPACRCRTSAPPSSTCGRAGSSDLAQHDADERRCDGLRVHLARRGRRPAPGRSGRLRDRRGRGVAGRGERAVAAARRARRHRRDARRATTRRTSWRGGATGRSDACLPRTVASYDVIVSGVGQHRTV